VRIWVDCTASAHPIVLRPVIRRLQADGHEVRVTARDFGQTLGLLRRMDIAHTAVGAHGGASRVGKLRALVSRARAVRGWAGRHGPFDLAIAHGSNDLPLAAASLGIPAVDMFDYEWATLQHSIGCRLATRVLTPDCIPPERLARYGAGPGKLRQFPGLKEEYYLHDFAPDPGVVGELGLDRERVLVTVRPPPEVSMYHLHGNPLFERVLERLGRREDVQAVVIPRVPAQGEALVALGLPSLVVPEHAVDAQSLIALSDLVISAGGTMNREAVALGVPVFTTFGGRLGGVDEALLREGRLRELRDPDEVELVKRRAGSRPPTRDPHALVELMLAAAAPI